MGIVLHAPGTNPDLPVTYFYNGTEKLVFDKECWGWYKVDDDGTRTKMYGVTGVLKIIAKEALIPWAVKTALARLKQLLMEGGYVGDNSTVLYESILDEIIAKAKKADAEVLTDAGDLGHIAHDFLENYVKNTINGREDRRLEMLAHFPVDDRAANCCIAGLSFFDRHNIRFRCAERPVYSRKFGCVGTMDALCVMDSCDDPACCPEPFKDSLALLDYKTSNALYGSYLGQAAIYQFSYQEETGEHIERRFIIRLGKADAAFESWHMAGDKLFEEDLALYVHALELYQSVHQVDDRLAEISKAATARRRATEKAIRDAEYAIKCPEADDYKGVRKKKCNGTDHPCEYCEKKYLDKHPQV